LPELARVPIPAQAEHLDVAAIGLQQAFQDLDRRRLAGTIGTEQAEALAALHGKREAVDGPHVTVAFVQIGATDGHLARARVVGHPPIVASRIGRAVLG
jgi:hypothetical protein